MKRATPTKKPKAPKPARKLEAWQRLMFKAVTRPLGAGFRTQKKWTDGTPAKAVFEKVVKPSATLAPLDRIEIYNRMYWYRMLDGLAEDFPGLRAFLGAKRFDALCVAYMTAYPSKSYTLRNLGSRFFRFLSALPAARLPGRAAALEMVRYEWAQVVAFDAESLPPLDPKRLKPGARIGLQPYLTLLPLAYPVDDYVHEVKNDGVLKTGASNALTGRASASASKRKGGLGAQAKLWVVVHRYENRLFTKRLDARAARLLLALQKGKTLEEACASAMRGSKESAEVQAGLLRDWFAQWSGLGWLCAPAKRRSS